MELVPELGEGAARLLRNSALKRPCAYRGMARWAGRFLRPIPALFSGAAPEGPKPLLEEFSEGGRLVLPVANEHEQLLKVYSEAG